MRLAKLFRLAPAFGAALVGLFAISVGAARAEDQATVGTCVSDKPALLRREGPSKPWQFVKENEPIRSGDLLLGGGGPTIVSANGEIAQTLTGDFTATSPFPIIETAVKLHASEKADLDFTLDRGAVTLTNRKEKGAAKVRIRIGEEAGELELKHPGDKVAVEVYGRWLPGSRFTKNPKVGAGPVMGIALLIIKGEGEAKGKTKHFMMKAPPGPALFVAENLNEDAPPKFLEKLPEWAEDVDSPREKTVKAILTKFRETAMAKSIGEALDALAMSNDPAERQASVLLMTAMDDIPRLSATLSATKHADVWYSAIRGLRHWLGRGPGQDQKLYDRLIEVRKYKPQEAKHLIDLLHGFTADQMQQPETYEALLDYLGSDRPAVRAVAHWHLVRMLPSGEKIGYDPVGPKDERDRCCKEWHKIIPADKAPDKSKPSEK